MDKNSVEGKFQWAKIWIVPGAIALVGVVLLAALFQDPAAQEEPPAKTDNAVTASLR